MGLRPGEIVHSIGRNSKRIAVTLVGSAVTVAGLVMLVLPGPGMLVVALGFAILGREYAWAASAFEWIKRVAARTGRVAGDGMARAARATHGTARSIGRRFSRR